MLALGCQYCGEGGPFTLGKDEARGYFKVALSLLHDVLLPTEALVNLQVRIVICNQPELSISSFVYHEGNHRYGKF